MKVDNKPWRLSIHSVRTYPTIRAPANMPMLWLVQPNFTMFCFVIFTGLPPFNFIIGKQSLKVNFTGFIGHICVFVLYLLIILTVLCK